MKSKNLQYTPAAIRRHSFSDRLYWATMVVSIVFLAFGTLFIAYAEQRSKRDVIERIQIATEQTRYAVDEYVKEKFETLSTASIFLEGKSLSGEEGTATMLSNSLHEDDVYVDVGFADASGRALWIGVDHAIHRSDLSDTPFISQALKGQHVFTEPHLALSGGQTVFYIAVPIDRTGMIEGAVFASLSENKLRDIIAHSLYSQNGFAHIIDRNGKYVLPSDSPLTLGQGNSVFDIPSPLDPELEQQVLSNMAQGKAGHLEKSIYQENRIVAYAPLNLNDWYVFYVVPESQVNAGSKRIQAYSTVVIVLAGMIMVFFVLLIRHSNRKSHRELERLAFEDPVTGHGNYRKFLMDAQELIKNNGNRNYAIWYGDIANFKYINALFGRKTGDQLLRYWTEFSTKNMSGDEAFARMNADIFVSLRVCETEQEILNRCHRGAEAFAAFPETAARGYRVEQHCGVYIPSPEDGELSVEEMVDRANVAQKSIKGTTKSFALYSNEMREQKLWETRAETQMEAALIKEEFTLYLQPKIDIQTHSIMGAEALARWISPSEGVISPAKFIPLFEKNGFIVKLDRYLFERACRHYKKAILEEGRNPLIFSVNVSRIGLLQPDFLEYYIAIKAEYEIPDGKIELEFTESLIFENNELFQTIITELHQHGFLCSLDDFGAGYSSLNILKSLPVDVLKLDGLFFRYDEDSSERAFALIRHVIAMAGAMGMKTVAEGIETEEQVTQLRKLGCNAVQGYVFAKPMPLEAFRQFIQEWERT